MLMARVGAVVTRNPQLMKLISFMALFATDALPDEPEDGHEAKWMAQIHKIQVTLSLSCGGLNNRARKMFGVTGKTRL